MGAEFKVVDRSSNINLQMESDLVYLMKDALDNHKGLDFITAKCQESFGGSWIMIVSDEGKDCSFYMSFAFKSLKWIKFKYSKKYYLFQISE